MKKKLQKKGNVIGMFLITCLLSMTTSVFAQVTYNGNGNTGFGGPVGESTLEFNDDGTTITGTFNKGINGDFNNEMVIYIDSKSGGFSSTANFDDPNSGDKLRRSIAGYGGFDGSTRSVVNFPTGFEADYAVAINTSFGGLWELIDDAEFPFQVGVGSPNAPDDSSFSFSFNWSNISSTSDKSFKFIVTYLDGFGGGGVFRSDEGYGNGLQSGNPGTANVTFTSNFNYPNFYVHDTNGWQPEDPSGVSTIDDNLSVESGTAVISANTIANNVILRPESVLDLNADIDAQQLVFTSLQIAGDVKSAQLADVSGSSINAPAFVQRYIPATTSGRAFRFLTSSVNSSGSIFQNWQNGGVALDGVGTHITGDVNGNDGFDASTTGDPSMYTFDNNDTGNQDNAWNPIPNTDNTNLVAGETYRIFIRGDRNYDLSSNPPNAPNSDVILQATGNLVTGNQTFNLSQEQDYYSLVGNPYQANVNMTQVLNPTNSTNVNTNFYWVWDPNMSTQGAYVAVDLSTGNSQTPGGSASSSDANQFVMPGQSFFVQTVNGGAADITFTEASKEVTATSTAVFSENNLSSLNLKLYKTNDLNNQEFESDALQINFDDQFDNTVTIKDADKLMNPDENLARNENDELVSIEKRSLPMDGESLSLYTKGFIEDDYTFVITNSNLPDGTDAYLVDHYTGDQTLLNDGKNQISFTVDESIPESTASDRFSLDFDLETFGIDDNELADNFKVYPNPVTDGQVSLQSTNTTGGATISLYNMIGQRVFKTESSFEANGKTKVNLGTPESGVYFIEIDQNGVTAKERLIVK